MKVLSHLNTVNAGKISLGHWCINSSTTLGLIAAYHVLKHGSLKAIFTSGGNLLEGSLPVITPEVTQKIEELEVDALNKIEALIDQITI